MYQNLKETFNYDNLDRLDNVYKGTGTPVMTLDMSYETSKGGITWKSDVGTLLYAYSDKPYAVSGIDTSGVGLVFPEYAQEINYTSFESVGTISENDYLATFTYNSDNQRAKMVVQQNGNTILTRWYPSGSYIKETAGSVTKEYTFIGGDAYSAPVVAVKTNGGEPVYYYLLRDYLGSITHVVDATGNNVVAEYSYDAWGRMRNPSTWEIYSPGSEPAPFIAGRGYTGHEHLPWFSFVNMLSEGPDDVLKSGGAKSRNPGLPGAAGNGRVYDPLTGQFLSPDNYVQAPDFTQSFNRYGYCLNNPLIMTDPDGEFIHLIIGAIIGGTLNVIFNAGEIDNFWEGLGYFGIGAAAGALSAGVGVGIQTASAGASFWAGFVGSSQGISTILSVGYTSSFINGALAGAGAGFAGSFVTGFGNGLMGGQSFGEAMWSGTKYGFIGGASGALLGGLAGGIDAVTDGRNFWHGGTRTVDVSLPIPQVNQAGQYDCNYACAESVDSYYGNGRNQSYFQTLEPGNGQGLTDVEIGRMYGKAGYGARPISINTSNPVSTAGDIANTMSANKAVVLNYNTGISGGVNSAGQRIVFGHATVVTRVRIFDNGRFIINVMNPGGSTTRFTNANLFHLIFGVY